LLPTQFLRVPPPTGKTIMPRRMRRTNFRFLLTGKKRISPPACMKNRNTLQIRHKPEPDFAGDVRSNATSRRAGSAAMIVRLHAKH
jgi:hypothetical protein